jgi:hypothetical protein
MTLINPHDVVGGGQRIWGTPHSRGMGIKRGEGQVSLLTFDDHHEVHPRLRFGSHRPRWRQLQILVRV